MINILFYALLFAFNINSKKTEDEVKTTKKDNSIKNAKKDSSSNDQKNKINKDREELILEIVSKYEEGLKNNIDHSLLKELLVFYIKTEYFEIEQKMQAKSAEHNKNLDSFTRGLQEELYNIKDNMTTEENQNAMQLFQNTMKELSENNTNIIEKFNKDKELALIDFVDLMNFKIKKQIKNDGKSHNIDFFIVRQDIIGKNNKTFQVNVTKTLNDYLNSKIKISSYNFATIPTVSGFFDTSNEDDDSDE